jgi:DNA-binding response OmpR family regulator
MSLQLRILIVEDDPLVKQTLAAALEASCDAQLWTAATGDQGLALATLHRPDLLLLDLNVPGLKGQEVCAAIAERSDMIATRIWIMTGLTMDAESRETLACYADRILEKPLSVATLSEEIRSLIQPQGPPLQWLGEGESGS